MEKQVFIQNLKCGGCANTITKEISKVKHVSNVKVDESTSSITFEFPDDDVSSVLNRLDQLGYPPAEDENSIYKQAKSYVSCMIGRVSKQAD